MLRLEYVESVGYYRVFNIDNPNRTVAYESDYYRALARVTEYNNRK